VARVIFIITTGAALLAALRFQLVFVAILSGWLLLGEIGSATRSAPVGLPELSYDDRHGAGPEPGPSTESDAEAGEG
jgi:hypothetical protein